jgi:uncharacterized membrane protein
VVIVALIGLGMVAGLVGLVVAIPLVGHASWHAYRDLQAGTDPQVGV